MSAMNTCLRAVKYIRSDVAYRYFSEVKTKTAILMLNMGGPRSSDEVHDFLLRVMTDRDMIQLPAQSMLGPYIAKKRTPEVQKKYNEIGGGSPILKWTRLQGDLLCKQLDVKSPTTAPHKAYVAFRYANPLTETTLAELERDGVERVVIFSQYPQYCCATSGSSFNAIYSYYKQKKTPTNMKWSIIDRWATHPLLARTFAHQINKELDKYPLPERDQVILLFSAHSIPLKAVNRGDAYPSEVSATVHNVLAEMQYSNPYQVVWQSKVGPLPWLGPFTDEALEGYAKQGKKNFLLIPIAFVNEHIETLHELDIEYCQDLGKKLGITIGRVPSPNDHPLFIDAMTDIVTKHLHTNQTIAPKFLTRCPHCTNARCYQSKKWFAQLCSASQL